MVPVLFLFLTRFRVNVARSNDNNNNNNTFIRPVLKVARLDFLGGIPPTFEH